MIVVIVVGISGLRLFWRMGKLSVGCGCKQRALLTVIVVMSHYKCCVTLICIRGAYMHLHILYIIVIYY